MKTKNLRGISTVISAIATQLCMGTAYVWSIFQTGIAESIFSGDNAAAGLTFSLLLATLAIGSVIGGKLAMKYSTRIVIIIGGIILSLGFLLASFVTSDAPSLLWLTYGVMGGIGMGFTYSPSIALAQKWYPHKKGLVTGVIVSALGFGGVVFTPVIEMLIKHFGGTGVGETKTFMVLSVIFLVVCSVGGMFMFNPPEDLNSKSTSANIKPANEFTTGEMLKSPKFYIIASTLMLGCMGGLMMIGFAKPIAEAKGLAEAATIGVLLISMFNSIGRLLWGIVSDKIGRKNTILILLFGTTILSLLINLVNGYSLFILIGFIGFFYGGLLSTFPALTADLFGAKHMSTNYGVVLVAFGIGAIASSQIAGHYKDVAANANDINLMFPAFLIASICSAVGFVLIFILKKMSKNKKSA